MSIMSERAPQDVIREEEETAGVSCRCRVVVGRNGEVSINDAHCELHGPKPGSAEFAQTEQAEAERRLANGK